MSGVFSTPAAWRRRRAAARATGPLAAYYRVPPPAPDTPVAELRLLALDVETTGLDADSDALLSLGWVPVDRLRIELSGAAHRVLRTDAQVGQSAIYHGITDDQLAAGVPLEQAIAEVLDALAGRVLLAHFAHLETSFLSRACQQLFGAALETPVIDTLALHDRLINTGFDDESRAGQLRLWNARTRYGLPRYRAHGALTDALACAELFLAQAAEFAETRPQTLRTLRS